VTGPDHPRFRDDAGAYLLHALDDDERRAFELHMESCPDCRDEVERLRLAADALPRSVEQLAPPERLRASIMDAARREAPADGGELSRRRAPRRRLRHLLPSPRVLRPVMVVGALAVGLVGGYAVSQLSSDETRTITAQVDSQRLPMASAKLRLEGDGDHGAVLIADGLPDPGERRVYQAWVMRGDKTVVPAPTFVADRGGSGTVGLPDDLSGAKAVLVTREHRGGARTPSENPVMRVDL
jgi:anti-sigma-K factor RskA